MRSHRSFIEQPLQVGQRFALPEACSQHLLRVLRLGVGDRCTLFNGDGHDYACVIRGLGKRECEVEVVDRQPLNNESPLRLHLLQGIARGEKMDLILQKATELGVTSIQPVVTERTEVRLDSERATKRHAHWLGVIRSACEQSGRATLPQLAEVRRLNTALADALPSVRLLLDPQAEGSLRDLPLRPEQDVLLLIGPEGGLGESDVRAANAAGFVGLRLGPRVLRTETAGLAALSALQTLYGDLA